jgi:NAD(P)H-dependent FMN reductase
MKVLILNGSPKENGNTAIALNEMIRIFTESLLLYDDSDQLRGIFTPSDKE